MSEVEGSHAAEQSEQPKMSKSRMKKLKRDQAWEAGREARKVKRKEKTKTKKQQKRAAREAHTTTNSSLPTTSPHAEPDHASTKTIQLAQTKGPHRRTILPITFIIDCGFDDLMTEVEHKSLASQITRSYSENRKAHCQAHLMVSSFRGQLKERFEGLLESQYLSWKDSTFLADDFVEAKDIAMEWTQSAQAGMKSDIFDDMTKHYSDLKETASGTEVVYLTSDSPDTLTELKARGTYIIGGLVDRNRHKGVCYKKATGRGIRTAKLPIGEYMDMNSRFVLTTNHVVEILLRWLELRDWGKAFMEVMPKRKGGTVKPTSTDLKHLDQAKVGEGEDGRESSQKGANENRLEDEKSQG
ncbi:uncharacterized protein KY384_005957 [Bacidia gigantensis]|uniref:uncharacterized protein n=1 Tax=Bacidia gigantensis TaxID=2732470 RepID=UPI001D03990B|nr:uncharacterized protein KY384_005957 [Bacidia gigantensis]KAG8529321.1 hypothetical protein KY384_005957 [Bacidia gigantensis]